MQDVTRAVKEVTDIMSEIAVASEEQRHGIEQVNQAITQMDAVTQQNAALVEQAAAAARSLEEQGRRLDDAVSIFRLGDVIQTSAQAVIQAVRSPAAAPRARKVKDAVAFTARRYVFAIMAVTSFLRILMQRFLILFLVCLLPLQVFASMLDDRLEQSRSVVQSAITLHQSLAAQAADTPSGPDWLQDDAAAQATDPEDISCNDLTKDLPGHASFGDDAAPAGFLIFALHSPAFISTPHDDAASIPPYLPPAARPPQA